MEGNLVRYTLRVNPQLLEKLGYIADFEGRSKNKELEQMIKRRIAEFEAANGKIDTMQR
ncbi:MAG: TraY domain-containing protein [Oscillospiraceae bacterium]|nr:TraY domain-containing protein [Oscillospiraceae bacterium]